MVTFNNELKKAITTQTTHAPLATLLQLQQSIEAFIAFAEATPNPSASYVKLEENLLGLLPFTMERLLTSLTASAFTLDDIPPYIRSHWLSDTGIYKVLIHA